MTDVGTTRTMPGDPGLPLIGYTVAFATGRLTASLDRYERHGPVSWSRSFGRTFISAGSPEAC
ncbi:MAG: cytochrome P450, partial [Williamsia herbipolensis]|nr:cytochrome P450 [Williamsia herbipolensis]